MNFVNPPMKEFCHKTEENFVIRKIWHKNDDLNSTESKKIFSMWFSCDVEEVIPL